MHMNACQSIPNTKINVGYFQPCTMTPCLLQSILTLKGKHLSHHYHQNSVFPDFELYGFMQLLFCVRVLQLHFMSVRYIVVHFSLLDPSLYEYNHNIFNPFYSFWTFRLLSVLGFINKASINIPMHAFQQMYALISFEYIPIPNRIAGHRVQICVALVKLPSSFPWCLC